MTPFQANLELNDREFAAKLERLESLPVKLGAVLTTRCNLRCIMCARHPSELDLAPAAAAKLPPLFPFLQDVNWQGGEPFFYPGFRELLDKAAEHAQLRQHIVTNGTLIDAAWAKAIVGARARLIISIDAATPATYEKIRRPGKFAALLKALDALNGEDARAGVRTHKEINVAVMRANHAELPAFVEFARKHRFSIVNFHPVLFQEAPGENIFQPGDAAALERLHAQLPEVLAAAAASGLQVNCTLPARERAAAGAAPRRPLDCAHPWRQLFVDVSRGADVYPECFCRVPLGNLLTDGLAEIWNGPAAREYRRRLASGEALNFCSEECTRGCFDGSRLA
ncbi:MAG: radical SAM protein [Elusimicrobiales bacterium]|nr:radical SAM protein [Elusimicrobiales bacterium]